MSQHDPREAACFRAGPAFVCSRHPLLAGLALLALLLTPLRAQQQPSQQAIPGAGVETAPAPAAATAGPEEREAEARLQSAFARVEAFSSVSPSLRAGVVVLEGEAPTPGSREDAARLAAAFPGVLWVDNRLSVGSADPAGSAADLPSARDERIAESLRSVFREVEELRPITVDVRGGVVHLRGKVLQAGLAEDAERIAAKAEGVLYVDSDLSVETSVARRLLPSADRLYEQARELLLRVPLFAVALLVVLAFWWIGRKVQELDGLYARLFRSGLARDVARQLARSAVVLLGLFLALEILDATRLAAAVLGTAGIVGLVIGFAFRDIAENYLASILLSVRRPFRSLDIIRLGEHVGKVVRLTTSDTILLTYEGNHLRIPNATIFKGVLENLTRNPLRRFEIPVGIGTSEDLERAGSVGIAALRGLPGVSADPEPFSRVQVLGDSAVQVSFFGWVDQREADFDKVRSLATREVKAALDQQGIDMPVPTQEIRLRRYEDLPVEPKPAPRGARSEEVAVDRVLDGQVVDDVALSGETDLLSEPPP